ncbi:hypothetical protein IWQ61_005180 [Dispira simplex]|nr:hypothetical protein IWQ61_005180 [Dispira simplex]
MSNYRRYSTRPVLASSLPSTPSLPHTHSHSWPRPESSDAIEDPGVSQTSYPPQDLTEETRLLPHSPLPRYNTVSLDHATNDTFLRTRASLMKGLSWHAGLMAEIKQVGRGNLRKRSKWLPRPDKLVEDGSASREAYGVRVWYDDYTTIDWIHEFVKEQVRLRSLRSLKGCVGTLHNLWDSVKAWLLVIVVGVVGGCLAAIIDILCEYLSDIKTGYCQTDITLSRNFCCKAHQDPDICPEWTLWSQAFTVLNLGNPQWVDFLTYCSVGVTFALVSALLVYFNPNRHRGYQGQMKTTYYAAGSGIPEVKIILSGFVMRGFLGIKTLWVKSVGLVFSVASGIITGKEGPFVHVACCVGNIACRLFDKYEKNDGKRREILSASAAAGVAMAFGAPIGGVLFSLEQVSYFFSNKTMFRSYMCALTAAMTLKFINPFGTNKIVMFQVLYDREWHWFELGFFLVIGIFGGLYGSIFCKLNSWWIRYRRSSWIKRHQVLEVLTIALVTLVVSYPNIYTRMNSTDLVATLFEECREGDSYEGLCVRRTHEYSRVFTLLAVACLNKAILTIITFGLRIPHGIFTPSLVIGACFGRLVGTAVEYFYRVYPQSPFFAACDGEPNCITPGVYAMVGGAAVLCGVTKMTLSLVVVMFELTGTLTYILPIMVVVLVSKWVSDFISIDGVYENMIRIAGHPFLDNQHEHIHSKSTGELVQNDLEVIDVNNANTVASLKQKLRTMTHRGFADGGFPLLDEDLLVGYISCSELEHALEKARSKGEDAVCLFFSPYTSYSDIEADFHQNLNFTAYVDQAPLSVGVNASIELVTELFKKLGLRYLCVVEHGRYVGVIHKKRFLKYLQDVK